MLPNTIQLASCPCPLGCPAGDDPVVVGRDRLHNLPGEFAVVRCRTCGLMRTNPRPTLETIGYYYPDDYGPFRTTQASASSSDDRPLWKRALRPVFQFNTERLPSIQPGRMLEIGCASGAFLQRMAGQGWQVEGVEASAKAAARAQALGFSVYAGPLEQAPDPSHSYDLIVGWMVLEHLHNPVESLRKLWQWTRPGGWLALSVPNAASHEFRIFKDAWYALSLPTHLYHYTPESIQKALEAGGWHLERIFHQRVLGYLAASIGYILQDRGWSGRITKPLLCFPESDYASYYFYPLGLLLNLFGQTGCMTVWARKLAE